MISFRNIFKFVGASLLVLPAFTRALELIPAPANTAATLQQFGSAQTTHTFLLRANADAEVRAAAHVATEDVVTRAEVSVTRLSATLHNVSVALTFDGLPGEARYSLIATQKAADAASSVTSLALTHDVLGVAFYDRRASDNGAVVRSGDAGELVLRAGESASRELLVAAYGGSKLATRDILAGLKFRVRPSGNGKDAQAVSDALLPEGSVSISQETGILSIEPAAYRTGVATVEVEMDGLSLQGESLETYIAVRVERMTRAGSRRGTPVIEAVLDGEGESLESAGDGEEGALKVAVKSDGKYAITVRAFNVGTDVLDVEAYIGQTELTFLRDASEFGDVWQTLRFAGEVSASGDNDDLLNGAQWFHVRVRDAQGMTTRAVVRDGNGQGRKADKGLWVRLVAADMTKEMADMADKHGLRGGSRSNGTVVIAVVLGTLAGLVLIALAVAAWTGAWRRWSASDNLKRNNADGRGVGSPVHIARDVYGRGSRIRMSMSSGRSEGSRRRESDTRPFDGLVCRV